MLEMGEDCEDDDVESVYSEDSPEKKTIKSASKKDNNEENKGIEKWEKNVKRRVYDALNVLYAAGVLRKEGKYVSCNPNACELNTASSELSAIEAEFYNDFDQLSKKS